VPVAAPSSLPPATAPESGAPAPGDERVADDLDQFFAALRQVVHDAREQVAPDERGDDVLPPTTPTGEDTPSTAPPGGAADADAPNVAIAGTSIVPAELAPSTAELIASLEADRDLWRERAVVWRERALGADMLVKALNSHMSDLQFNLEDLRIAMRVLADETTTTSEPQAALPGPDLGWGAPGLGRQVGPGPQA